MADIFQDSDAVETIDSFWELVDRINMWLKHVNGLAMAPYTIVSDVIIAVAIMFYYKYINPPAIPCPVTKDSEDKWRHCYVGCKLGFWIPNGFEFGIAAALLKELVDLLGPGNEEIEDFVESLRGIGACGFFQSCEDCCCEKGY